METFIQPEVDKDKKYLYFSNEFLYTYLFNMIEKRKTVEGIENKFRRCLVQRYTIIKDFLSIHHETEIYIKYSDTIRTTEVRMSVSYSKRTYIIKNIKVLQVCITTSSFVDSDTDNRKFSMYRSRIGKLVNTHRLQYNADKIIDQLFLETDLKLDPKILKKEIDMSYKLKTFREKL